jgi:site-specific DNA-cytosine methylase
VFVVGYLGDWRRAAEVLFKSESVSRHPAPSREKRQETAKCLTAGVGKHFDFETEALPIAFHNRQDPVSSKDATNALGAKDNGLGVMAFSAKDYGADASSIAPTLRAMGHGDSHANGGGQIAVAQPSMQVRRLTPVECERLQGFPDGYTNIPWRKKPESPDAPRYKALGNSMAVPVMRWIGERIAKVDAK